MNDVAKPIKGGFGGSELRTFHEYDPLPGGARAQAIHDFGEGMACEMCATGWARPRWRAVLDVDPPTQRPSGAALVPLPDAVPGRAIARSYSTSLAPPPFNAPEKLYRMTGS